MSDERDWDEWLERIEVDGVNLTAWEEEFVESIRARRETGRALTDSQAETLERIYSARTP